MAKLKVDEVEATSTNSDINVITKGSTGALEIKGNSSNNGTLQLNCSAQSHGVKLKAPTNNADLGYTMTLPDNQIAASKILKVKSVTNNNAQLEYADVPPNDLTSTPLDATNITSGTLPSTRIPDFPASTGLGFKLISVQEVTSSSVNNVQFTGLEDNSAYHLVFKNIEAYNNINNKSFYAYPLDASNNMIYSRLTGLNIRHNSYVSGAREQQQPSDYIALGENSGNVRFGDGPFSGHMDFYTGNSNSVQINNVTSGGMWGNSNSWSHSVGYQGEMVTHEHWFTWQGSYRLQELKGLRLGYNNSSTYIKPNAAAKFLLYKYQEV